jgi:glycosyltransferase involved in cell wall biosynthesis
MMWSSGIGSYIRYLVPYILDAYPDNRFYLLGRPQDQANWDGFQKANVSWISMKAPIYSIFEQLEIFEKTPLETDLFWAPHYNVPVFRKSKLLVTVHDVFHLAFLSRVEGFHRRLYAKGIFKYLTKNADAILTVSDFTRSELIRLTDADTKKITVIHNGVDESWFKVQFRERPHHKPYILFVGNIKPHKNLSRLLEAFGMIRNQISHDLVLVGKKEGFLTAEGKVFVEAEKFKDRVYFSGLVDEDKLKQYYAFADLLVFPSLYEGFGLPPLEAMAIGLPTLVSRIASIPEVCGTAAEYFDPYDSKDMSIKILKALKNETLRHELIQRGLEQARLFSWNQSALKTNLIIRNLLEG